MVVSKGKAGQGELSGELGAASKSRIAASFLETIRKTNGIFLFLNNL